MEAKITPGFHHITMVSTDARRTLSFFGELLGLPLVKKTVNYDDPSSYHLYFGNEDGEPGTILTFFEWPEARPGRWGVGGVHHLALGVPTAEAQLMWKRRLTDAGIAVSGPYDRGYFRSIYFRDPDGQVVEIATEGPGYGIDEPMDSLGARMIQPHDSRLPQGRDEGSIRGSMHPEPVPAITEGMQLTGIHHITGITDDIRLAGDFLESALGLRLIKKTLNQDDGKTEHFFWAHYDGERVASRSAFTLFGWPGSTHRASPGAGQTHHVAFRTRSQEEQLEWRERLLDLGVQVSPVQDRTYFKSIYFRAPDGLLLEIATDSPGFTVDEESVALGQGLRLPEWLEGERAGIERRLRPLETLGAGSSHDPA